MQGQDVEIHSPGRGDEHAGTSHPQDFINRRPTPDINAAVWEADGSLWQQVRWFAGGLIRQGNFGPSERADLEQALALGLWRRVDRYWDPRRGTIATFANRVLDQEAASILRMRRAKKRMPTRGSKSHNIGICGLLDATLHTSRHSRSEVELFELRHDLEAVISRLPPELQELSRLLSEGSRAQAVLKLGVSRRVVELRARQLLAAFESAGLGIEETRTRRQPLCVNNQ